MQPTQVGGLGPLPSGGSPAFTVRQSVAISAGLRLPLSAPAWPSAPRRTPPKASCCNVCARRTLPQPSPLPCVVAAAVFAHTAVRHRRAPSRRGHGSPRLPTPPLCIWEREGLRGDSRGRGGGGDAAAYETLRHFVKRELVTRQLLRCASRARESRNRTRQWSRVLLMALRVCIHGRIVEACRARRQPRFRWGWGSFSNVSSFSKEECNSKSYFRT